MSHHNEIIGEATEDQESSPTASYKRQSAMQDYPLGPDDDHSLISLDPPDQAPPDFLAFQAATQRFSESLMRNRVPPTIIEEDELSARSSMQTKLAGQASRQLSHRLESDATETPHKQSLKVVNESKYQTIYVSDSGSYRQQEERSYGQEESRVSSASFNREDITVTEQHAAPLKAVTLSDIPQTSEENKDSSINFDQSQQAASLMGSS